MTHPTIKGMRRFTALNCLLVFVLAALASDPLRSEIRFAPAQEGPVWVGEKTELNLELWSTGYSFGDQLFALPEVTGGYLMQADSTTVKLSESRGGVQWQGLSYTLLFYPQRSGRLEIPSFSVKYSSGTGYGSEPTYFDYRTPTLYIDARLPPGVEPGSLLVTTSNFKLEATWKPRIPVDGPLELKVGDALTLNVKREARDVPGMVFAPLPNFFIEGVSVYPGAPVVNDRVNRGSLTGSRIDSVTYIFEQEGRFTVPGLQFQWWDPASEKLSEESIGEITVAVAVNPAFADRHGSVTQSAPEVNWRRVATVAVLLVLVAFLLRLAWPFFKAGRRAIALGWLRAKFHRLVQLTIRDKRELPPLNPGPIKVE